MLISETRHIPVLLSEVLDQLQAQRGGSFLDCTLGGGGHSHAILEANAANSVHGIDRDSHAVDRGQRRFAGNSRIKISLGRFSQIKALVADQRFDGILADLGMSTDQLWEKRGFSFQDDAPLDMRMNTAEGQPASEIVNHLSKDELTKVLREGGVGRDAGVVAHAIVNSRPIETATQLASIVSNALRAQRGEDVHPATVVFQALRVRVNEEFEEIESLLSQIPDLINPGGRFAAISFHSVEDQLVTRRMRKWAQGGEYSAAWPGAARPRSLGKLLTKKAVVPSKTEISENPSARSARLRCFQFE